MAHFGPKSQPPVNRISDRFREGLIIFRGQSRLFREFLQSRRPSGYYSPKEYFFDATTSHLSIIRDPIYQVIQMRVREIPGFRFES
jgi:hypothetical protein